MATEPSTERKWTGTLSELCDVSVSHLKRRGFNDADALKLAHSLILEIASYLGGRQIYLPRGAHLKARLRGDQIFREFSGANKSELARRYGLTEVRIQQIIQEHRALRRQEASQLPSRP